MDCEEWGVCEAVSSHGAKLRRTGINTSSAALFEFGSASICENSATHLSFSVASRGGSLRHT